MGRANVYLPDDLERRVKAAQIPISEVCQRALQAAVEAAEGDGNRFDETLREQLRGGRDAGQRWAGTASSELLLTLVRDQRFEEIPAEALPADLYSLTQQQSLAWEAGFSDAARTAARAVLAADGGAEVAPHSKHDPHHPSEQGGQDGPAGLPRASESAIRAGTAAGEQANKAPGTAECSPRG